MRLSKRFTAAVPFAALAPMALVTLVCYLGTVAWSVWISLTASRSFPSSRFVGMAQYERLFTNERWMLSLQHLALYGVLFVAACLALGLLLAILLDRSVRGEGVLRTVFLYPYAMSFVATGLVWQWLLAPEGGIGPDWLVNEDTVMYAIVAATVWQAAGLVMVLMLAGLRGIDPQIWQAARLDGIPSWRVYLSVVLPQLGPSFATAFVLLASATVKLYDAVVAMTQGGPGIASEVPAKFIMDNLFGRANIGLASAAAVTLLVPVLALAAPYVVAMSRKGRA